MYHKKVFITFSIIFFSTLLIAARFDNQKKYKNLKVLPENISEFKLDSIMNSYNHALKVGCDFCHVKNPTAFALTVNKDSLDYAADGQMKENARKMIRMMIDINKNNFYFDKTIEPVYLNAVSCNTCHRGNPFPLGE